MVEPVGRGRWRRTVLDKMVLGQTLKTTGSDESLRHQYADSDRYLILLGGRPSVNVLQKSREGGLFQRFLKILISEKGGSSAASVSPTICSCYRTF